MSLDINSTNKFASASSSRSSHIQQQQEVSPYSGPTLAPAPAKAIPQGQSQVVNFTNQQHTQSPAVAKVQGQGQGQRTGNLAVATPPAKATGTGKVSGFPGVNVLDEGIIPHDKESEQALVGSLLLDRDVIASVAADLSAKDFWSEDLSSIYQVVMDLYYVGTPPDLIAVCNELRNRSLLGSGTGQVSRSYLLELMRSVSSPIHAPHYAEIIRSKAFSRKMIEVGGIVTKIGFDQTLTTEAKLGQVEKLNDELRVRASREKADFFLQHEDAFNLLAHLGQGQNQSGQVQSQSQKRLRFGWPCLDGTPPDPNKLNPGSLPTLLLQRSTVTSVLAYTGTGKTVVAEQIADHNASQGFNVLFFHNELSQSQLIYRRTCRITGLPYVKLENDLVSGAEIQQVIQAGALWSGWPGRVDFVHCPKWSGSRIAEWAKQKNQHLLDKTGRGYDLIILDYIQRTGRPKGLPREASRDEMIEANVSDFSDMVNELGVAGLMTSQINRASRQDKHARPAIDSGLGSSAIERCSNQVIGLWRDNTDAEFILLKNTFGGVNQTLNMTFLSKHAMFIE